MNEGASSVWHNANLDSTFDLIVELDNKVALQVLQIVIFDPKHQLIVEINFAIKEAIPENAYVIFGPAFQLIVESGNEVALQVL